MVFQIRVSAAWRTVAALLVVSGAAAGCNRTDEPAPPPSPAPATPLPPPPSPGLDRNALLAAIDAAASDAAAGIARPGPDPLVGRTFSLRVAFGCFGPQAATAATGATPRDGRPRWAPSADGRTLRLSLSPTDWSEADISGPAPEGFDSLSGVWINQPWMRSEGCPAWSVEDAQALPASAPGRLAAIVMTRPAGASRVGRSGDQSFTHTVRAEGDAPAPLPTRGYRLVLEGRLVGWADGRVVRCRVSSPEQPPACVIGAAVDRIAFEDGATGAMLSEWRPG